VFRWWERTPERGDLDLAPIDEAVIRAVGG
jgi:hypothetical protein